MANSGCHDYWTIRGSKYRINIGLLTLTTVKRNVRSPTQFSCVFICLSHFGKIVNAYLDKIVPAVIFIK